MRNFPFQEKQTRDDEKETKLNQDKLFSSWKTSIHITQDNSKAKAFRHFARTRFLGKWVTRQEEESKRDKTHYNITIIHIFGIPTETEVVMSVQNDIS